MERIQVIIEIPKELYNRLTADSRIDREYYLEDGEDLCKAVQSGVPIPEGHKAIDAYALQRDLALVPMGNRTYRKAVEIIDRFPSIIEMDKAESGDKWI